MLRLKVNQNLLVQLKLISEIREHMSPGEKNEEKRLAGIYGRWLGYSIAASVIILVFGVSDFFKYSMVKRILFFLCFEPVFITLFIIGFRKSRKKQKEFFSATTWAKSNGYKQEDIVMTDPFWESPLPESKSNSGLWIWMVIMIVLLIASYCYR